MQIKKKNIYEKFHFNLNSFDAYLRENKRTL